jgi:hypothetical protein
MRKGWKQRVHERVSSLGNKFKAGSVTVSSPGGVAVYKPEFLEAMKQPVQRVPRKDYSSIIRGSNMAEQMNTIPLDWKKLIEGDIYANQVISDFIRKGNSPEDAVHVYVNMVEGDASQLPDKLAAYAKRKGWLEGYEE